MDDLAASLLACIAEDEAEARHAALCTGGDEWSAEAAPPPKWGYDVPNLSIITRGKPILWADDDYGGNAALDHIARHDPARVLAECAAKRAIVESFIRMDRDRARLTDAALHLQWNVLRSVVEQFAQVTCGQCAAVVAGNDREAHAQWHGGVEGASCGPDCPDQAEGPDEVHL